MGCRGILLSLRWLDRPLPLVVLLLLLRLKLLPRVWLVQLVQLLLLHASLVRCLRLAACAGCAIACLRSRMMPNDAVASQPTIAANPAGPHKLLLTECGSRALLRRYQSAVLRRRSFVASNARHAPSIA
jgi:hypothetical protein